MCLVLSRNHKDASMAGAEGPRSRGIVRDDIRVGGQMGMGVLEVKSHRAL